MAELTIYGESDDLVELTGCLVDELPVSADYLSTGNATPYMGTLLVHSTRGRAHVHVLYNGTWAFALAKVDEDDGDLFPSRREWAGRTECLTLEVPKGTHVEWTS